MCLILVCLVCSADEQAKRIVILKIDGVGADLLYNTMRQIDPETQRSRLPWLTHIFADQGTTFRNFYTRGISLSAPSWSILDTGQHLLIHGNAEFDRYTGTVYDYLNFVPFYINYARLSQVDMPGVQVLDQAGIPLMIDSFPYSEQLQSFQLLQRGVRWSTLRETLKRRLSAKALIGTLGGHSPAMSGLLSVQSEHELITALDDPNIQYLDFYDGDIDHEGHATNDPLTLYAKLRDLDSLAGRVWTAIQKSTLSRQTLLVLVSDHGMNNVPNIISQTYSLPDLFGSAEGGGHHVVTNRPQLSDFTLWGLDPLLSRVITPSAASSYLQGEASKYPTAWLDIDGNERAAVHLRMSDLNKLHILLLELSKSDLPQRTRTAVAIAVRQTIDVHRAQWSATCTGLDRELQALSQAIDARLLLLSKVPKKHSKWTAEEHENGADKLARRQMVELRSWIDERTHYKAYIAHLQNLLTFQPDNTRALSGRISDLVPQLSLGDNNTLHDIQNYIAGPGPHGMIVGPDGQLDQRQSFRRLNYLPLLARQTVKNNPQIGVESTPVDFSVMSLPVSQVTPALAPGDHDRVYEAVWLFRDNDHQLLELVRRSGTSLEIKLIPAANLVQDEAGHITWKSISWQSSLPLLLREDDQLHIPEGGSRDEWLSSWHSEEDWMKAVHRCRYSNAVIGLTEQFYPVDDAVLSSGHANPELRKLEIRRRKLVEADFQVFTRDHWNFNVRFPNPGGNHGSFFRISTHSVWMMAGPHVPKAVIDEPYDGLNFASTVLHLLDRPAPMLDRVVQLPDTVSR